MAFPGDFSGEKDHYFNGFYRARVENNGYDTNFGGGDPVRDSVNRNRVQVRVIGLHSFEEQSDEYIPIANLNWAEQAGSLVGGSFGPSKSGVYALPEVGSWLWVFFENGNHNKPVYFASIIGNGDITTKDSGVTRITTPGGHIVTLIDNEDENVSSIIVQHSGGNTMLTLEKDDITISGVNVNISASGKISTGGTDNFIVTSQTEGPITIPGGGTLLTSPNLRN